MDTILTKDVGWFPAQGSYEESVLSWHEQIAQSSKRQELEGQRTGSEPRSRRDVAGHSTAVVG